MNILLIIIALIGLVDFVLLCALSYLEINFPKKMNNVVKKEKPINRTIEVWSILEYMQSLLDEANSTSYLRHDELIEEYNSIRKMLDVLDGDNHDN